MKAVETWPFPEVATSDVSASVVVAGVLVTAADSMPSPTEFTARSLILWLVPLVRPVITTGLLVVAALVQVPLSI